LFASAAGKIVGDPWQFVVTAKDGQGASTLYEMMVVEFGVLEGPAVQE
jgi:hypothetical protein